MVSAGVSVPGTTSARSLVTTGTSVSLVTSSPGHWDGASVSRASVATWLWTWRTLDTVSTHINQARLQLG